MKPFSPSILLALTLVVFAAVEKSTARAAAIGKSNIVFILADDSGLGEFGCYGGKAIRTPRLDRMAAEGMRFTQSYAGSPVCAPSRCVLMTGLHTGHARIRDNNPAVGGQLEAYAEGREGARPRAVVRDCPGRPRGASQRRCRQ